MPLSSTLSILGIFTSFFLAQFFKDRNFVGANNFGFSIPLMWQGLLKIRMMTDMEKLLILAPTTFCLRKS